MQLSLAATFTALCTLAVASPIAKYSNETAQSYRLSVSSNEAPELNGQFIEVDPFKPGAGIFTVKVGENQEKYPFYLSGTDLTTIDNGKSLYAQLNQPVDTYAAITFSDQFSGQQEFYQVEDGQLKFKTSQPLEWHACGDDNLIALYPLNAPQQGCRGINITASAVQ